jgi:hypothetical protein
MAAFGLPLLSPRRLAGAGLVVVLHVTLIALLLHATFSPVPAARPTHEGILWFVLPQHPKAEKPKHVAKPAGKHPKTRTIAPDYRAIALPPVTSSAPPAALHGLLFDCAPENLVNLSAEARAQCAASPLAPKQDDSVDYADHTNRSHNAARWAREKQRKNQPLLLPCASPASIFATAGIGTLICLGNGVINGFDLDKLPMYGDRPEQIHVPNNGDPPDKPPG